MVTRLGYHTDNQQLCPIGPGVLQTPPILSPRGPGFPRGIPLGHISAASWPKPNEDTGGEFIFLQARELGEDPRQKEKDTTPHRTACGDPSPMSLRPQSPLAIPEETHRVAHAA